MERFEERTLLSTSPLIGPIQLATTASVHAATDSADDGRVAGIDRSQAADHSNESPVASSDQLDTVTGSPIASRADPTNDSSSGAGTTNNLLQNQGADWGPIAPSQGVDAANAATTSEETNTKPQSLPTKSSDWRDDLKSDGIAKDESAESAKKADLGKPTQDEDPQSDGRTDPVQAQDPAPPVDPPTVSRSPANRPPTEQGQADQTPPARPSAKLLAAFGTIEQVTEESAQPEQAAQQSPQAETIDAGQSAAPNGVEPIPPSDKPASSVFPFLPPSSSILDDLARFRSSTSPATSPKLPSVLADLDSFFVDVWDDEQMLFPDGRPDLDETIFPDGIPSTDEMPFPDPTPDSLAPVPGFSNPLITHTISRADHAANLLATAANHSAAPTTLPAGNTREATAGDPLAAYKVLMCLVPFFFALGISPTDLRQYVVAARRRIPGLRSTDLER
jgi:hypothetical protein